MTLQFSIVGYAIIALFYIISAAFLLALWVRRERFRWVKPVLAVLVPIVLVLPWAEEVWIAWNFSKLCDETGVQITRIEKVDGFYDDTMRSAYELIERQGYRFMEHPSKTKGKVDHVEKIDGEWRITEMDHPSARYHYVKIYEDKAIARQIACSQEAILDTEKQERIAIRNFCKRYPNMIEGAWLRFLHHGPIEYCPPLKQDLKGMLYHHVLTPSQTP